MVSTLFLIGRLIYTLPLLYMALRNFGKLDELVELSREKGLPASKVAVIGSTTFLIIGLLAILFNIQVVIGSLMVASFLVVSGVKVHNFWTVTDPHARSMEQIQLEKNIIMAGAAIAIAAAQNLLG